MTREEAIAIIENEKECVNRANKNDYCNRDCYNCELVKTDTEILTALDMAIEALEQELCKDVISRQSAIFLASDLKQDLPDDEHITDMVMAHNEGILEYQTQLSLLPPVTPQQKTGHWQKIEPYPMMEHEYRCSECYHETDNPFENYCSECGARMVGGDTE